MMNNTPTAVERAQSEPNMNGTKASNQPEDDILKSTPDRRVRFASDTDRRGGGPTNQKLRTSFPRSDSVSVLKFLELGYYRKGYLTFIEVGKLYSITKKLFFKLSATHLSAFSTEQSKTEGKRFETTLREIDSIQIDKSNTNGENCFILQLQGNRKWCVKADSKKEMAEWMIAIDGLLSNIGSNSFNTYIQPNTDKKQLLKYLYKDGFRGGVIKSSFDEEWQYHPNGTVTPIQIQPVEEPQRGAHIPASSRAMDEKELLKVAYSWDGEIFAPKSESSVSFGAGQWSGVFMGWYLDEEMTFNTGKREKFLKYFYDPTDREFKPEMNELTSWKFIRNFLASKINEGEWIVEGDVPEPVVMFIQIIRYSRYGFDHKVLEAIEKQHAEAKQAKANQITQTLNAREQQQQPQHSSSIEEETEESSFGTTFYAGLGAALLVVLGASLALYKKRHQ